MYEALGDSTQILAHVLYHHYSAPDGFDFDTLSGDAPFVDDPTLDTYNAPQKSAQLHEWILE
jgi:lysosomal alpha-mannosidase